MARLRVRIELNRRMAGVPLAKMASVVEETRKFFYLLSEDVHIQIERGDWVASDFDAESLNFTAEYIGPVSAEQAHAFGAAFSGATSLRKSTIAQFTRIAEFLGEDELVGFGLFKSDQEIEPSEWRCLSKRDAMRFGEEIKLLAQAAGDQAPETQLPAVMNGSVAGRRLFKDRREREALVAADPTKAVRELESNLSQRIAVLEEALAEQSRKMQSFSVNPDLAQERFEKLLLAMEKFWAQAPANSPQFSQLPPPAMLPAPSAQQSGPDSAESASVPAPVASAEEQAKAEVCAAVEPAAARAPSQPSITPETPLGIDPHAPPATYAQTPPARRRNWSLFAVAGAASLAIAAGLSYPNAHRQWARFSAVEPLPIVKPKPPLVPVLPVIPVTQPATRPAAQPPVQPVRQVNTVAERSSAAQGSEPFVGPLIPLDIPAKVKSKIQAEVRVDVLVAIDEDGNVTGAHVSSTKGTRAHLLVTEALRAAKQSRFRPAREGDKTVASRMILTYLFKPEIGEF